jgi:hypothetical protein
MSSTTRAGRHFLATAHRPILVAALGAFALIAVAAPATAGAVQPKVTGHATTEAPATTTKAASAHVVASVDGPGNDFPASNWRADIGKVAFSSPTIAEIDNQRVLVIGSLTGYVYVMNAANGDELPGWPKPVDIVAGHPTAVDSSPAVAYLDGPTKPPTIIVGAGSLFVPNQEGGVEAFWASGAVRFIFHTKATFNEWGSAGGGAYDNSVFASPAVGDIRGDGQLDIVFGSYDHYIYALQPDGQEVPGFPMNNTDTIWSSPALFDVTGTGKDDIYTGADATGLDGCHGGWLYDIRYVDGAPRIVWRDCRPQAFWSSPAIGVINDTGRAAVVIGTSWDTAYTSHDASNLVYAFYAATGLAVPGWPVHTNGPTFGSPAIGSLNGSSQEDVVDSSCAHCAGTPGPQEGTVEAWTGTGQHLWTATLNQYEVLGSPVLVDLTHSGGNDVVIGNTYGMYLLSGRTGGFIYGTGLVRAPYSNSPKPLAFTCAVENSAAVTDVPGQGWRLFDACGGPDATGYVYSYPFAVAPADPPAWPEFRMDATHDGDDPPAAPETTPGCKAPSASAGYRFIAGDGGVFNFAGLPYCGSTAAVALSTPVIGLAATHDDGGYWVATADGCVYAFGNAAWYGSMEGQPVAGSIVSLVAAPNGLGYYLLSSTGKIYPFGDVPFWGDASGMAIASPFVTMVIDPVTQGYWLVEANGNVYAWNAPNHGGLANIRLTAPIVGMSANPTGTGYWMVASDGGIFAFGGVHFLGSMGGHHLNQPIVGMATNPDTGGYWLVARDGGIFSYDAPFYGSTGGIRLNQPIVGMSTT